MADLEHERTAILNSCVGDVWVLGLLYTDCRRIVKILCLQKLTQDGGVSTTT